jgi:DNA-binding FrmR family transcriptional regulator
MAHTIRNKQKLIHRVRRLRGQVEAIERALVSEMECSNILQRIAACRGSIDGLLGEVLEDHVRFHVIERHRHRGADPVEVGEELIDVISTYLR